MTVKQEYVLGTDRVELERLGVQHRLWADTTHAAWRAAGIQPGSRVLDIGCGPGYAAVDLAQLVGPNGRVVGVDESPGFVSELNRRAGQLGLEHLTGVVGDVHQLPEALPPGEPGFDAAYARWVLCFVADPERVVRGVAASLRPGGRFCVMDYFNYTSMTLAPRDPALDTMVRAIHRSWAARGGDSDIVGRLPAMMSAAGLRVQTLEPHLRTARPGEPMWAWPTTFWKSFVPRLVEGGYMTRDEGRAVFEAWDRATADPDRFMALPPVWVVVGVKE